MFEFDPRRTDLALEYKANPFGEHSPDLQNLLNLMRKPDDRPLYPTSVIAGFLPTPPARAPRAHWDYKLAIEQRPLAPFMQLVISLQPELNCRSRAPTTSCERKAANAEENHGAERQ